MPHITMEIHTYRNFIDRGACKWSFAICVSLDLSSGWLFYRTAEPRWFCVCSEGDIGRAS